MSRFRWFLMNTAPARDEMTSRWLTHQCRAEVTGPWKDLQKGGLSWVVLRCLWLNDRHFSSAIKNKSSKLHFIDTLCDYLSIKSSFLIHGSKLKLQHSLSLPASSFPAHPMCQTCREAKTHPLLPPDHMLELSHEQLVDISIYLQQVYQNMSQVKA